MTYINVITADQFKMHIEQMRVILKEIQSQLTFIKGELIEVKDRLSILESSTNKEKILW